MQVSSTEQTVGSPAIVYFGVHADEMAALGVVSTVDDVVAHLAESPKRPVAVYYLKRLEGGMAGFVLGL